MKGINNIGSVKRHFCAMRNEAGLVTYFVLFVFSFVIVIIRSVTELHPGGYAFFSPDSWTYYDLSQSIFSDPYRTHVIRSYFWPAGYGTSFPYLYPLLIGGFNLVFDIGIFAGYAINMVLAVIGIAVITKIGRQLASPFVAWVGIGLWLLPEALRHEFGGARTTPLAMIFFLLALSHAYQPERSQGRKYLVIGFLLGAAAMVRFDALLPGFIFGIVVAVQQRSWRIVIDYFCGFAVPLIPWIIYSWIRFDAVFVSDNMPVAISVPGIFSLYYPAVPYTTLFDYPLKWLAKLLYSFSLYVGVIWDNYGTFVILILTTLLSVVFAGPPQMRQTLKNVLLPFGIYILVQLITVATTTYSDARYFALFIWFAGHIAAVRISRKHQYRANFMRIVWMNFLSATILVIFLAEIVRETKMDFAAYRSFVADNLGNAAIKRISDCLPLGEKLLFKDDPTIAARLGATTGRVALMTPSNWRRLSPYQIKKFLVDYDIQYLFMSSQAFEPEFKELFPPLQPLSCDGNLYKIETQG